MKLSIESREEVRFQQYIWLKLFWTEKDEIVSLERENIEEW